MIVDAWLPRAAAARPDHPALETAEGTLSYAELDTAAVRAARRLAVRPGSRVAIALPPGRAFAEVLHGALRLGAVAMPIDVRLSAEERAAWAAAASIVVEEPPAGPEREVELMAEHALDSPALVMHTSGTTAAPTPVELTHGNLLWSALGSALALGSDPADRWLCPLPLAHVGGLSILIRSTVQATTVVLHERFDAERVAVALMGEGITLVSLVPTMLARLLDEGLQRPPGLRCVVLGGAPAPAALLDRAAAAGVPVAQTYGLTEAASQVTMSLPGEAHTAGLPLTGSRVRLAADGEILVSGPTVAPGALAADGWLHTGDLGALDDRGRLSVVGRKADTIVTGGENVAPVEVEAVLLAHPAVVDAAVHARTDAEWGEAVVATVVVRPGGRASADELRAHCAARLAGFKVPKDVAFADELPRTAAGKLLRSELANGR